MMEKLHKMVDGKRVELSGEEEVEVRAEWASAEAAQTENENDRLLEEKRVAALEAQLRRFARQASASPEEKAYDAALRAAGRIP